MKHVKRDHKGSDEMEIEREDTRNLGKDANEGLKRLK